MPLNMKNINNFIPSEKMDQSMWRLRARSRTKSTSRSLGEVLSRGWHSYTLTRWSVGHVSRQPNHWAINRILLLWDWTKSRLFMYKGIYAYCCINMQNLYQAVIYGIATTDFITVLCRLINCSTPKTASYNYLLAKLLLNVKFYLNQNFHELLS